MKPVEGTILTVSRGAAIGAKKKAEQTNDAVEVMRAALEGAKTALAKTPDMLPVLKKLALWIQVVKDWSSSMKVSFQPLLVNILHLRTL